MDERRESASGQRKISSPCLDGGVRGHELADVPDGHGHEAIGVGQLEALPIDVDAVGAVSRDHDGQAITSATNIEAHRGRVILRQRGTNRPANPVTHHVARGLDHGSFGDDLGEVGDRATDEVAVAIEARRGDRDLAEPVVRHDDTQALLGLAHVEAHRLSETDGQTRSDLLLHLQTRLLLGH